MQLLNLLEKIFERLEGLITAAQSVAAQAEHISFENLVKHLVELKFSDLPRLLKDLAGFQQAQKEKTKEETAEAGRIPLRSPRSGPV